MRRFMIILVLSLAGVWSVADAQCVRSRAYYGAGTYHAPIHYSAPTVYKDTYVAPYAAPTYYTPRVIELYTPPEYYYSVQSYYRDQQLADAIAYRILTGQQKLNAPGGFSPGTPERGQPQRFPPMNKAENEAPSAPPVPQGNLPNQPKEAPPSVEPAIKTKVAQGLAQLVETKCLKCHNGTKPERLNLSDLSIVPPSYRSACFTEVNIGAMPQGQKELSNEEVKLFLDWYNEGKQAYAEAIRQRR